MLAPVSHYTQSAPVRPAPNTYTCVTIGDESYAIEARHVVRVVSWRPDKGLRNVPTYVLGAMTLDGMRLPVVDLHAPFGQTRAAEDGTLQVLVLRRYEDTIGIIIDALEEPITLSPGAAVNGYATAGASFLSGSAQLLHRRVTLLSNDHIFELTRADMVAHLFRG